MLLKTATTTNYLKPIRLATQDLTIEKSILLGSKLRLVKNELGTGKSVLLIALALKSLSDYLNLNNQFNIEQCLDVSELMLEQFPEENIEDVLLYVKNMKLCKYGTFYNRLDGQIIFQSFRMYLDEKYQVFEKQKQNEKTSKTINVIGQDLKEETLEEKEFALNKLKEIQEDILKIANKKMPDKNNSISKPSLRQMAAFVRENKVKK